MSKKYLYAITFLQLFVSVVGIVLIIMNLLGIRNTDNLFMFVFLTILAITQCIDNIAKIRDKSHNQWWLGTNQEKDTVFMWGRVLDYINISDYQRVKYKDIIKIIFETCSVFKIIDEYGDFEIKNLEISQDLIDIQHTKNWNGVKGSGRKVYVYSFKLTREVRIFLKKYNSFFEENSIESAICNTALNGQYDYSFIEKETGNCILYIITHEGEVFLRKDIYNKHSEIFSENSVLWIIKKGGNLHRHIRKNLH